MGYRDELVLDDRQNSQFSVLPPGALSWWWN